MLNKEAIWWLSNATSQTNPSLIQRIVDAKGLETMVSVLKSTEDAKLIMVVLEGLENILRTGKIIFGEESPQKLFENILESCGGVEKLEELQEHPNEHVYEKTVKILEDFFCTE